MAIVRGCAVDRRWRGELTEGASVNRPLGAVGPPVESAADRAIV